MRTLKIIVLLAFTVLAFTPFASSGLFGKFSAAPEALASDGKSLSPLPNTKPEDYIGSNACADCHANTAAHYQMTAHRKTINKDAPPEKQGCEGCHGGAKQHVEFQRSVQKLIAEGKEAESQALMADSAKLAAGTMPDISKLSSKEASQLCLQCHESTQDRHEERFNFRRSEHYRHGVSCLDCHSSHSPKRTENLLKEDEPEGCYQCHADQKVTFARPFHHKVPEGGMKCSDCHNHHGGFQPKQLRSWASGTDMACIRCHSDKAGPFVYEHAPVKTEGCQACHSPHGSTNPKLLKRNEVRFLCLECHSNTPSIPAEEAGIGPGVPTFHDINGRHRNCTVCHLTIHGSNSHPAFFR